MFTNDGGGARTKKGPPTFIFNWKTLVAVGLFQNGAHDNYCIDRCFSGEMSNFFQKIAKKIDDSDMDENNFIFEMSANGLDYLSNHYFAHRQHRIVLVMDIKPHDVSEILRKKPEEFVSHIMGAMKTEDVTHVWKENRGAIIYGDYSSFERIPFFPNPLWIPSVQRECPDGPLHFSNPLHTYTP